MPPVDTDILLIAGAALGLGLLLGALIVRIVAERRIGRIALERAILEAKLKSEQEVEQEREHALSDARDKLASVVQTMANRSFQDQSTTFLKLAEENLGKHQEQAKGRPGATAAGHRKPRSAGPTGPQED